MSSFLIGLFVAIGVGGWTYSKLQRSTGGADIKTTLTMSAIAGGLSFLFIIIIWGLFF